MISTRERTAALANRPPHLVEDECVGVDEGEEADGARVLYQGVRPREVDILQDPQDRDRQVEGMEIRHETLPEGGAGGATGGHIVQDRGAEGGAMQR